MRQDHSAQTERQHGGDSLPQWEWRLWVSRSLRLWEHGIRGELPTIPGVVEVDASTEPFHECAACRRLEQRAAELDPPQRACIWRLGEGLPADIGDVVVAQVEILDGRQCRRLHELDRAFVVDLVSVELKTVQPCKVPWLRNALIGVDRRSYGASSSSNVRT